MSGNVLNSYAIAARRQSNFVDFGRKKAKSFFANPIIQFILLGVVFAAIQVLRIARIIPTKYALVACNIMIYTIVSVGFCLLLGYAGLASLGSSCFVGIGAYCAFFCLSEWGVPYIGAIIMAIAIAFVLGLSIGFISLRVQGLFLGIITMGLSEIIRIVLKNIDSRVIFIRNRFLKLFGLSAGSDYVYFVIAVIMVLVIILIYNLMHSPTGRNMLAMKNSTSAAQAFGVNLLKYRVLAFIIACVTAALTGVTFITNGSSSINPASTSDPTLSLTLSLNVLAAVIIGGYKSLWGTFAGTVFVFGLSSIFTAFLPNIANKVAPYLLLIIGVLMIVIIMFYPGGFYQLFYLAKFKIKALKEKRRIYRYGAE